MNLEALIIQRHPLPQWATFDELNNGTGALINGRIDVAAFNVWPSAKCYRVAYEVKRSRRDFLRELSSPEKRAWAEEQFHETYFVCSQNVCTPEEIPDGWGLLLPQKNGEKLRLCKVARTRSPGELNQFIMLAVLRRACEDLHNERTKTYRFAGEIVTDDMIKEKVDELVSYEQIRLEAERKCLDSEQKQLAKAREELTGPLKRLYHYHMRGWNSYDNSTPTVDDIDKWVTDLQGRLFREVQQPAQGAKDALEKLITSIEAISQDGVAAVDGESPS